MDKRYQVFISSTYTDLKEERQVVFQTLMEMDCIPAGMELFPAADEEQFNFIKKIIDDCDYYILIIGGRYGSLTKEGISYTELEFNYAAEKGIKAVVLVHEDPGSIAQDKSEIDPNLRKKLECFKEKACADRLVKYWSSPEDLAGKVALSMQKTIKMYPARGWVRSPKNTHEDLLEDINKLRKENEKLTIKLRNAPSKNKPYLLEGGHNFIYSYRYNDEYGTNIQHNATTEISWLELFQELSLSLDALPEETDIKRIMGGILFSHDPPYFSHDGEHITSSVDQKDLVQSRIQFEAAKLISVKQTIKTHGVWKLDWQLTKNGRQLMLKLNAANGDN